MSLGCATFFAIANEYTCPQLAASSYLPKKAKNKTIKTATVITMSGIPNSVNVNTWLLLVSGTGAPGSNEDSSQWHVICCFNKARLQYKAHKPFCVSVPLPPSLSGISFHHVPVVDKRSTYYTKGNDDKRHPQTKAMFCVQEKQKSTCLLSVLIQTDAICRMPPTPTIESGRH